MNAVKEMAYAKVNLYLEVAAKRPDGFHDIKTVMHTVSLSDELTVSVSAASTRSVRISVAGNKFVPEDGRNLACRAAELFLERLGIDAAVDIKIVKKIPMSAGLAGGSADAAATLRALNRIYKKPFTERALMEIGATLGSDVPFCIKGKTALCQGRGERVEQIKTSARFHFAIAVANERVSTPMAYAELDKRYGDFAKGAVGSEAAYASLMSLLNSGRAEGDFLYNVFESVTLDKKEGAAKIKQRLTELCAVGALMSGSGPSVYGIFDSEKQARFAVSELMSEGFSVFYARSV